MEMSRRCVRDGHYWRLVFIVKQFKENILTKILSLRKGLKDNLFAVNTHVCPYPSELKKKIILKKFHQTNNIHTKPDEYISVHDCRYVKKTDVKIKSFSCRKIKIICLFIDDE